MQFKWAGQYEASRMATNISSNEVHQPPSLRTSAQLGLRRHKDPTDHSGPFLKMHRKCIFFFLKKKRRIERYVNNLPCNIKNGSNLSFLNMQHRKNENINDNF